MYGQKHPQAPVYRGGNPHLSKKRQRGDSYVPSRPSKISRPASSSMDTTPDRRTSAHRQNTPSRRLPAPDAPEPSASAQGGSAQITSALPDGASVVSVPIIDALIKQTIHFLEDVAQTITSASVAHLSHMFQGYTTGYTPSHFYMGQIVWGPWVVSNLNPNALKDADATSYRNWGWTDAAGPACGKMKPMLIYAIYQTHVLGFPINTSEGHGLNNKDIYTHANSVPLVPHFDKNARDRYGLHYFRMEAPHRGKANTYIDLTKPYVLSYQFPMKPAGELSRESTRRLQRLVVEYGNRGFDKLNRTESAQRPRLPFFDQALESPRPR